MSAPQFDQARRQIADTCRELARRGLVLGTAGNVSVRVARPGSAEADAFGTSDAFAITPTGGDFATMEAHHVVLVDADGHVLAGDLQPTSELGLHLGLYRSSDTGAIVHTHAPMATAVSCVLDELPCIHYQMLALGGAIPVATYATFGTQELVRSVLGAMEGRPAVLMANHGALTHGQNLEIAVAHTLLLEWACEMYWRAASIGKPRALDTEQQMAVIRQVLVRNYGTTQPIAEAD
ncbi:class II aldolase/adducin family protein [Tomitella biformata]|uniref:class II aldolase/adducin family protein n=1 Tax=Tomitella biformata TaxID=630403 RepID=UPI000467CBF6|nr:class II aldolase/adducin family protein [Tomitella biformata]